MSQPLFDFWYLGWQILSCFCQINVYNITKVWYDIKVNKDTITQISDISNRILVNGEQQI